MGSASRFCVKLVFCWVLLLAALTPVAALKCYSCQHSLPTDNPCVSDPAQVPGAKDVDCGGQCYWTRQVTSLDSKLYSVIRGCDTDNVKKDEDNKGALLEKTRVCSTDVCNTQNLTYVPDPTVHPTTDPTTIREALTSECPPGYYLNGTCMECPHGSYQPLNVSVQDPFARACKLCPPGMGCPYIAASAGYPCAAGRYCPQGCTQTSLAIPCPPTFYCPAGSAVPTPCPSGTVSTPGARSIESCSDNVPCAPGQYRSAEKVCSNCPQGTFQPSWVLGDINYCQPCPPGSYCITTKLDAPSGLCLFPGYHCPIRSISPTDAKCPRGFYCPGGSLSPIACPTGTSSEPGAAALSNCMKVTLECPSGYITEARSCTPCLEGTYASEGKCVACPAGKFCSGQAKTAPSGPCSAGYYCPVGSTSPTAVLCPDDHYCIQGSANATQCTSHTNAYPGSSSCSSNVPALCEAGYYNDGGQCETCHRGYYKPTKDRSGMDACLPCPPGSWCQVYGIAAPQGTCYPGHFCPLTSRASIIIACPHDHYCPEGSPNPVPCPEGTQSPLKSKSISRCI